MRWPSLAIALLLIAFTVLGAEAKKKTAPPTPRKRPPPPARPTPSKSCEDPYRAFKLLSKDGESGPYSTVLSVMRQTGVSDAIRAMSRGKAILAPTNAAVEQALWSLDFVKAAHTLQPRQWNLTAGDKAALMGMLGRMVVPSAQLWRSLRSSIRPTACRLLATTSNLAETRSHLVLGGGELWPGQLSLQPHTHRAAGRRLQQSGGGFISSSPCVGSTTFDQCNYNVFGLGSGYDVYKGLPTTTAGLDPGIKFAAIYDFSDNPNVTVVTSSSAKQSGSATASTSTASYQTTNTAYVSGSANYEQDSFTASASWTQQASSTDSSTAATYSEGTALTLFTYNAPSVTYYITEGFANDAWNILQSWAYDGYVVGFWTTLDLQQLYSDFGTAVMTQVVGGALANSFIQMSAQAQSSLDSQDISVSASASANYGLASGSLSAGGGQNVSSSVTIQSSSQVFTFQLTPSNVVVPYTSGTSNIDVVTWTEYLQGNVSLSPTSFTIANISTVFQRTSAFTQFPCPAGQNASTSSSPCFTTNDLRELYTIVNAFMADCNPNGLCVPATTVCNPGFSGAGYVNGVDECNNDYAPFNTSAYSLGLYACEWNSYFGTGDADPTPLPALAPFSSTTQLESSGYHTYVLQTTTTTAVNNFGNIGNTGAFTWQLTGYFVPATSGTYTFQMSADDYGFMWLDTASTTGAEAQPPTGGNALVQNLCCGTTNSAAIALNAGQGYPIRAQFANAANGSPGHLTLSCSINGSPFSAFTSGGPCGTMYYNPATISSPTNPGY